MDARNAASGLPEPVAGWRTGSTPVGAGTVTRSPVARNRNVVIDAAVGMRPVSPLMPRRATTMARSSGKVRLNTGAGRRLARIDGPRSFATFGASGLSVHDFGQYGTLTKNAMPTAVAAIVRSASRERGIRARARPRCG